jgi:hypothetical protein
MMSTGLVILTALRLRASSPEIVPCKRIVLILLGGNALVVAMAMVQVAPTIELFLHSRRSQPIPYSEVMDWSLNPVSLSTSCFWIKKSTEERKLSEERTYSFAPSQCQRVTTPWSFAMSRVHLQ